MEKINSSLEASRWVDIAHASDIAAARREGTRMADALDFDETRAGQLAIVITEAATNILKHAGHGRMLLSVAHAGDARGIEVLAFDQGPGISNLAQALRDGVSSAGTAGNGLGALRRLSDQFDVYAPAGKGAVFYMRLWRTGSAAAAPVALPRWQAGAVCLPLAGETVSGDAWAYAEQHGVLALMVADGLGHGPEAAKASAAAVQVMAARPGLRPAPQMEACHAALRPTRGAALALALVEPETGQLYFAGVGNIGACVVEHTGRRQLVSHNGIVGHNVRKIQEFQVPCGPGALIVMASDGISTQWELSQYPGLVACAPAVIAAVLLRDHARGRDDASVLVLRCPEAA